MFLCAWCLKLFVCLFFDGSPVHQLLFTSLFLYLAFIL